MPTWQAVLVGIIPSIGVGLIFWFAIRSVIRADRNERAALARMEAEQDAAEAAEQDDAGGAAGAESARNSSAENSADAPRDIQS
ncbi:hypothetical protein QQX10_08330 [Demequina sp. SYSU T00039]|uniref:Lysyl-tRNA synthetase n=1 Tax=Demequina lignilytica TaxID=3051663 RepID=A0AAW7M9B1_9MICO|nr:MULTISPECIES: hypothetical protein [unclassified Demequina]MDN4477478.1 hypothetical protein [Demequina sp. SYSU T00039-1]MDN4488171.1 hypothetical protein [Demequina sp. SYSU T00039]MDN4490612.1 hypothetical protein [Demequina sp. SYSU T00068]